MTARVCAHCRNVIAHGMGVYTDISGRALHAECAEVLCLSVHKDAIITNENGGRQSRLDARYDLIPPYAEEIVAEVLAEGAVKYGQWNWLKIPSDSHLNHARQHIAKFIQGDKSEDHAAHAATRIAFWLDMLKREGKR